MHSACLGAVAQHPNIGVRGFTASQERSGSLLLLNFPAITESTVRDGICRRARGGFGERGVERRLWAIETTATPPLGPQEYSSAGVRKDGLCCGAPVGQSQPVKVDSRNCVFGRGVLLTLDRCRGVATHQCAPPNDLPRLAHAYRDYVVLGPGKRGWMLASG